MPRLVTHRLTPRFADIDAVGHVNNAAYSTYLEEARIAFFRALHASDRLPEWEFVLARVEIDFRRPILFGDIVEIDLHLARWGSSSFDFAYEGRVAGAAAFAARSVQVFVESATGRSRPIPKAFRDLVDSFPSPP